MFYYFTRCMAEPWRGRHEGLVKGAFLMSARLSLGSTMSEVDKQGLPKWVFRFLKVPLQDAFGALMGAFAAIFATSGLLSQ